MQDYLKEYQMRITALSPIYVGNGMKIGKKEYIQQGETAPVIVPDMVKMFSTLHRLNKEQAYEEFMLNEKRIGLGQWLKEQKISRQYIESWKRYSMDAGDAFVRRNTGRRDETPKEIMCFMKDAYECPYISGSTLKGMFRTALLCWRVYKNRDKYKQELSNLVRATDYKGKKKTYLQKETETLETAVFHTLGRDDKRQMNAVNSIMSGFVVSDSKPISENQLILARKIDYNLYHEEKNLPILRETLAPGTQIDFSITIDNTICDVTIEELMEALEYFKKTVYDNFYAKFGRGCTVDGTVWLGGGTGFLSKTILYPLYGRQAVKLTDEVFHVTLGDNYNKHKHYDDIENGVSPHVCKCTRYQGKLYDMGAGKIEIL